MPGGAPKRLIGDASVLPKDEYLFRFLYVRGWLSGRLASFALE